MKEQNKTLSRKKGWWRRDDTEYTLIALPTTIWYILFSYLPMFGVIIAFKRYQISGNFLQSLWNSAWVGLQNFQFLISSPDLRISVRNTVGYNVVMIIIGMVLSIGFAIIISEVWNKPAAKVYQTVMFFPYFLSWVVASTLIWGFLSPDNGMVNTILETLGLRRHNWYMEKSFWPGFLIFISQWKGLGYGMIVYLATITSLDKAVFEAAVIDGATKWQQICYLTLPMMKTVIVLMFIMSAGRIFNSDFGLFYQVPRNSGALYETVVTLDVFVYNQLKSAPIGMAAAAAFAQSAVSCALTLFINWIVRKVDSDSAMI
jgi:putative aldouronate transport system permease protein